MTSTVADGMVSPDALRPGVEVVIEGAAWRFVGEDEGIAEFTELGGAGRTIIRSFDELRTLDVVPITPRADVVRSDDDRAALDDMNDLDRMKTLQSLAYVRTMDDHLAADPTLSKATAASRAIDDVHPRLVADAFPHGRKSGAVTDVARPSPRTVEHWHLRFHDDETGGVEAIASRTAERGASGTTFARPVLKVVVEAGKLYVDGRLRTATRVHQFVERRLRETGLAAQYGVPSLRSIQRYVTGHIHRRALVRGRKGPKAEADEHRPATTRMKPLRFGEEVQIDCKVGNALVRDDDLVHVVADIDDDGKPKRAFLVAAIDVATGYVLASRWFLGSPNARAVTETVGGAFIDQRALLATCGVRTKPLPIVGWKLLISDNGSEFRSAFKSFCARIGLDRRYTALKTPEDRAVIERFFGTVHGFEQELPAQTGRNLAERAATLPEDDEPAWLEVLNRGWYVWLHDVYHNDPRWGVDGLSPLESAKAALGRAAALPAPSEAAIRAARMVRGECKVSKTGVRFEHLDYWSPALAKRLDGRGGRRVDVRSDPDRMDFIEVRLHGKWVEVPLAASDDVRERFGRVSLDAWRAVSIRTVREGKSAALKDRETVLRGAETLSTMMREIPEHRKALMPLNVSTAALARVDEAYGSLRSADVLVSRERESEGDDPAPEGGTDWDGFDVSLGDADG